MTSAMFLEAIGMVNDKAIKDAKEYRRPKSRTWVKWGTMAACLCLLVVAAIPILSNMQSKDPVEPH